MPSWSCPSTWGGRRPWSWWFATGLDATGRDLSTIGGLVEQTSWTILCRGTAPSGMDKIRVWARERGLLGARVYVVDGQGESLWLAGDLADAVWVAPD
ncbi:MAG: hypothetical protein H8E44_01165, partial [Planctomycetes bacterium]|nr:hypothetical protein [Planctomycetota bacterium]